MFEVAQRVELDVIGQRVVAGHVAIRWPVPVRLSIERLAVSVSCVEVVGNPLGDVSDSGIGPINLLLIEVVFV